MHDSILVGYESRKLKNEKNYSTHELDVLVIAHTLKYLCHYLIGCKF